MVTAPLFIPFAHNEAKEDIGLLIDGFHANVFASGGVGSGKSTLLHAIIRSITDRCSAADAMLWLYDKRGYEFRQYAATMSAPQIEKLFEGRFDDREKSLFEALQTEEETRINLFIAAGAANHHHYQSLITSAEKSIPRLFVLIDGFHQIADYIRNNPAYRCLFESILLKSRALGITIIVCDQTVDAIPVRWFDLFSTRIALRNQCTEISRTLDKKLCDDDIEWFSSRRGNLICNNIYAQTKEGYQQLSFCRCSLNYTDGMAQHKMESSVHQQH